VNDYLDELLKKAEADSKRRWQPRRSIGGRDVLSPRKIENSQLQFIELVI